MIDVAQPPKSKEVGAVAIETLLVLPLLTIFTFGLIDLGNWFTQYYSVSRIVYEGARTGASLRRLKAVAPDSQIQDGKPCITVQFDSILEDQHVVLFQEHREGHFVVMDRMRELLLRQFDYGNREINWLYNAKATFRSCFNPDDRLVETSVTLPFGSMVGRVLGFYGDGSDSFLWPPVNARATAPYLYVETLDS